MEIHTLEIPKARKLFDSGVTEKLQLLDWMKFLDAKTEEELNMLAQKSPVMKKATMRLLELSADEKARQLYESRLKEQRDNYAREKGAVMAALKIREIKMAKSLLALNMPIDNISTVTGLTHDEIEALPDSN